MRNLWNRLLGISLAVVTLSLSIATPAYAVEHRFARTAQVAQIFAVDALAQLLLDKGSPEKVRRLIRQTPVLPLGAGKELSAKAFFSERFSDLYLALQKTEEVGVFRFVVAAESRNGKTFVADTGTDYNVDTGLIYGRDGKGILGSGYDYVPAGYMTRQAVGNFKKIGGYNIFYDLMAPLVLINVETLRFTFDYQGKDWMVQLWKGQYYYTSNGAEIGIYEKPKWRPIFWSGADTLLDMGFSLWYGAEKIVDYSPTNTWWAGGFRYGNLLLTPIYPAKQLRMTGSIAFADKAMLEAFMSSVEENKPREFTGQADGLVYRFEWKETN
jgi:hypothetical protein